MESPCNQRPSEALLQAVEEFNVGDWFECHETLEDLWVGSKGELRDFYQGLLMIAVALHHWRGGNYKGSVLLLHKGTDHLGRVSAVCQGIDIEATIKAARLFQEKLTLLGPDRMAELAPRLIPKLRVTTG